MRISDWSSDVCSSDLVIGGWLPSMLAAVSENSAILLDRNVVTEIVSRFDSGETKGRPADFIDKLAGMDVSIDRKSVVSGKSVSVRVDLGGRLIIKKKRTASDQQ